MFAWLCGRRQATIFLSLERAMQCALHGFFISAREN
jgi:hypothetical protein